MPYKFLEHTADIKILVEEKNLDEAFKTSALALKEVMSENSPVKGEKSRIISIEGDDIGDLLYNFLEEFIYLLDAERLLLSKIEDLEVNELKEIKDGKEKKGFSLTATIIFGDAKRLKFSNKVKAITFNDMKISEDKKTKKCTIQFVLDV